MNVETRSTRAERFEAFLAQVRVDVYPEPPSETHSAITEQAYARLKERYRIARGARVLDVGCGQGVALRLFREDALAATGITLDPEDIAACRAGGFDVLEMDQSFLEFDDATFDAVWCRHCLEHSVAPYFTLSELYRVTRPGALVYIEVPAPDTACRHETNRNHYSVLGKSAWLSLMTRAGFAADEVVEINLSTPAGPDTYWAFVLRRPAEQGMQGASIEEQVQGGTAPAAPESASNNPWTTVSMMFEAAGTPQRLELKFDTREFTQRNMAAVLGRGEFYEPEVSYFLTNVLAPGDAFIDVGAHIGYFAGLAARTVGETGRVLAFEPEQRNFARVQAMAEANGLRNLEVFNVALGAEPGRAELRVNLDNDGGHALWEVGDHAFNVRSRGERIVQPVEIATLDSFLDRTRSLNIRLIKIDAEGSEHAIVRGGMLTVVGREVPYIICEINEFALQRMGSSQLHLRAFMETIGYRTYLLSADAPHLRPLRSGEPYQVPHVFNVLFTTQGV